MNAEQLQRFTAGEAFAVDPDAIERELASLWRAAGQQTDMGAPVTRACLVNIIAVLEERPGLEGFGTAETLQHWIDELPRFVAARSLVVRSQPDQAGQQALQSWISANCIIAGGGGKLVCSEEVTFAAQGGADHHVPGLTRALLVPGLPTNLVVAGVPFGALANPLLQLADRVITDVDRSTVVRPLAHLGRVTRDGRHSGMDLGWVATAALRAEVAGAFDAPFDPQRLNDIREIRCTAPPTQQWSTRLLLGWLGQSFGGRTPTAQDGGRATLQRPGGVPLNLTLTLDAAATGPRFAFVTDGERALVRVESTDKLVKVVSDHLPPSQRPRQELSGPAALARSLVSRAEDGAFRRALEIAESLP